METETDGVTDREREVELPDDEGIGVVHLFLLEELRDGQQLFQHVLQTHRTAYDVILHQFDVLIINDYVSGYTPAVLLYRCSRYGVRPSERRRSHAGQQGLVSDQS